MANELKYGDVIALHNEYTSKDGGFLDIYGNATEAGAKKGISTAATANRDRLSGAWKITSASGKADGTEVLSLDIVHLENQFNGGQGGYLDINGRAPATLAGALHSVSTTDSKNRDRSSGSWRVLAVKSSAQDGKVRVGDIVHLLNDFNDGQGGFLDINGRAAHDDKWHEVSTSRYVNRADVSTGSWRITKP
ncbi:hypothetical protein ACWGH2_24815 [Streptomyces sp. NPDC054871]